MVKYLLSTFNGLRLRWKTFTSKMSWASDHKSTDSIDLLNFSFILVTSIRLPVEASLATSWGCGETIFRCLESRRSGDKCQGFLLSRDARCLWGWMEQWAGLEADRCWFWTLHRRRSISCYKLRPLGSCETRYKNAPHLYLANDSISIVIQCK